MPSDGKNLPIGGIFPLAEPVASASRRPPFITDHSLFLLNGRSAIALLIDQLSPRNVWVPSYVCEALVTAVKKRSAIEFYEVDERLSVPDLVWMKHVQRGDLVIVIDYFGFPSEPTCARIAKEQGAWVLQDACQALLTTAYRDLADVCVFSPRKFLGIPDGGILNRAEAQDDWALGEPPGEWWLSALRASLWRRDLAEYGGGNDWFSLFRAVEASAPT